MERFSTLTSICKIPKELPRANTGLALIMAETLAALELKELSASVRKTLKSILDASYKAESGVPVSVAAKLLGISERTARSWLERGVLKKVTGATPIRVRGRSLAEALNAVRLIRTTEGQDARALRYWGENQRFETLKLRLEEMGARTELDVDNLDEELFV